MGWLLKPERFVLTIPALLLCNGCAHQCTEAGCFDGFALAFDPPFDEPGEYSFTMVSPGETIVCDGSLTSTVSQEPKSACSLMVIGGGIGRLTVTSKHPESLTVEVSRDGNVVLETQVTLRYETTQPNGPDCTPTCRETEASVETR